MKKIKIKITKNHQGLEKGTIKRVISFVAVKLMVEGYAEQVDEEGVKKIDIDQLKKNRKGDSGKAKKLSTLRQDVLAAVDAYHKINSQSEIHKARVEACPENEKFEYEAEESATASKKAFDKMQKLSKKYESLIAKVKGDSIEIPEATEENKPEDKDNGTDDGDSDNDSKEKEIKDLTEAHEEALQSSITAEEGVKAADEAAKENPDDAELKKVHEEAINKSTDLLKVSEKAEAALEKAKEGVDEGWLKKLFKK